MAPRIEHSAAVECRVLWSQLPKTGKDYSAARPRTFRAPPRARSRRRPRGLRLILLRFLPPPADPRAGRRPKHSA